MPIILDDLQAQINTKKFSPKYFHAKLTGNGKKSGLLKEIENPIYETRKNTPNIHSSQIPILKKEKNKRNDTEEFLIPTSTIYHNSLIWLNYAYPLHFDKAIQIAQKGDNIACIYTEIEGFILTEERSYSGSISKYLEKHYRTSLYIYNKTSTQKDMIFAFEQTDFSFINNFTIDERAIKTITTGSYNENIRVVTQFLENNLFDIDYDKLEEIKENFSIYENTANLAETWQTNIENDIEILLKSINYNRAMTSFDNTMTFESLKAQMQYLNNYPIPLDSYTKIYKNLQTYLPQDISDDLCKENFNLLLSNTLNSLNNNRANLAFVPKDMNKAPTGTISKEQLEAVMSDSPLVLTQAAAGTGKSTTIRHKLNYMIDMGIDPSEITVLSFTNAAADNIKRTHPDINSWTIASMIHKIYSQNFPTHNLSTLDTLINSVNIYYPYNNLAYEFKQHLINVNNNKPNSSESLNNFIEKHFDDVMKMLDTMKQTSLEIEIMVCYQKIDQLVEPAEVQTTHLIIDEVQDNAVFEFIYTLKYVDKHKGSLFIVGRHNCPR